MQQMKLLNIDLRKKILNTSNSKNFLKCNYLGDNLHGSPDTVIVPTNSAENFASFQIRVMIEFKTKNSFKSSDNQVIGELQEIYYILQLNFTT